MMNSTPQSNRLHIGIFGRCNSGKSTLVNTITGQQTSIVSETPGTTTDLVTKSMEIAGIGPCLFMDTAGFDDTGILAAERLRKTTEAVDRTDIAIIIFSGRDIGLETEWIQLFRKRDIPIIAVVNQHEEITDPDKLPRIIRRNTGLSAIILNALTGEGVDRLLEQIIVCNPANTLEVSITGNLVDRGDVVMLVMPQDMQAPKGRLILPQMQTIRELLDKKCIVVACTPEEIKDTLESLVNLPNLVIIDSQMFGIVSQLIPEQCRLTSFSVLFAHYKGDIIQFINGAKAIGNLTENSRVLIAEACTHAPLTEDIGREKIPRMLRRRVGESLKIDIVSGSDFPDDLSRYDLIIHCGACMFNRRHVLSRVHKAAEQYIPITNYGIAIAWLTGMMDRLVYPL